MRGVRYGEVLAVFLRDGSLHAEVYGTQMLNDCPQELWDGLDATAIAAEMGAAFVKLNGPRYWTIDGAGAKVAVVEPVFREFNGLEHAPHRHPRPRHHPEHGPVHVPQRQPWCRLLLRCRSPVCTSWSIPTASPT